MGEISMSINSTSLNRIGGLASGMDTDTLVKSLMAGQQAKIDKIKQKQQKNLWISDSYRQWNSDLLTFRSKTLFNAKMSSTFNAFSVTSGQPNSVSASTGGGSIAGTYNIQVKQLAEQANFTGKNIVIDPTKTLGDAAQGSMQLITADPDNIYSTLNFTVNSSQTAAIEIKTTDKIGDIVNKINSTVDLSGKSLGLQAIYDANLKQFIIRTRSTGASQSIDISSSDPAFLQNYMGIGPTDLHSTTGKNADVVFNGESITTLTSNTASIMGISWTFKSPTVDSNGVPTSTAVNVSEDIDAEVKNIKDIINNYNDLLDKLNKATEETVYRSFPPLTDEQREVMSDKQIEQWESKAKSGLLHGDSIIGSLTNKLRSVMYSKVDTGSVYNSLSAIGISSTHYMDKGRLTVDETKLKAAIQADPDGVQKLFNQTGSLSNGTEGLVHTLSNHILEANKSLTVKAGTGGNSQYDESIIGKLLKGLQTQISTETNRFQQKETRFYNQFTAMEKVMQKYNSQGSWLTAQLSAGQN
jgi:flagellar hook-associated protein 2